jgi:hypothetical protein
MGSEDESIMQGVALATAAVGLGGAYFLRDYFRGGVCMSQASMKGKTVVSKDIEVTMMLDAFLTICVTRSSPVATPASARKPPET